MDSLETGMIQMIRIVHHHNFLCEVREIIISMLCTVISSKKIQFIDIDD